MWNGKSKAVTFSFDDGVTQDIKLIKMLNGYGLKATFNLNSGLLGTGCEIVRNDRTVGHFKVAVEDVRDIYTGHEVAVHTLTHPNLTTVSDDEIIRQVEEDRKKLSEICGYEVRGMAYPGGGVNNNEHVAEIVRENTGVKFSRTTTSTYSYDLQSDKFRFNPTVSYTENCLERIVEDFLSSTSDRPQLLYIWGHSYEMDADYISWEKFEEICKKLSGREEIFYGTNSEVLL